MGKIYQSASMVARFIFFLALFAWMLPVGFGLMADPPVKTIDGNPYAEPSGFDADIVVIVGWLVALAAFFAAAWQLRRRPRENLNWISAVVAGIYALSPLFMFLALSISVGIWRQ